MEVIITKYTDREHDIRTVRDEVFLREQQISREDEVDDRDASCVHVVIRLEGRAVATGRIDVDKGGKIGRVAVLPEVRRRGVGRQVMQALEEFAWGVPLDQVWFHAQRTAIPFYLALGYRQEGEEFIEANIPHVKMSKPRPASS